ncbi:glycosyltransferase family 4 protein [Candidatus Parcubacteria bacterium]|nr:glycosyltransferase family 4 protein [Candidatus Parcubacteria bacterium]
MSRILIITQKVDRTDDVLGFFHLWLEEFATQFQEVSVICLYRGDYALPENVSVYSLGKEKLEKGTYGMFEVLWQRIKYVTLFYRLIWQQRTKYDYVFVHMNSEYVIFGAPLWKIFGKRIILWYNHTYGTLRTKVAMSLSNAVCHTSEFSFTAGTKKSHLMSAGIATDVFKKDHTIRKKPHSLLYVGRISAVKNVDVLLRAFNLLIQKKVECTLDIYGDPGPGDQLYFESIKGLALPYERDGLITFHGKIPNSLTPAVYNAHQVLVNLTPRGNFDKTVLEAMSTETVVAVSSPAFASLLPLECRFKERDDEDLAQVLNKLLMLPEYHYTDLGRTFRNSVVQKHDLKKLVKDISVLFAQI